MTQYCVIHKSEPVSPRSKRCCEKCLARNRELQKRFAERFPEKIKAQKQRHYKKYRDKILQHNKELRLTNGERWKPARRAYFIKYRTRVKADVINHYSNGHNCCACCGETMAEFLTMDHISGNGAEHRRELNKGKMLGHGSGYMFYKWLIDHGYPSGYRVLCMNCNFSFGIFGYCPHQKGSTEVING